MGQIKIIWGSRAVLSVQTQKFLALCVSDGRTQPSTFASCEGCGETPMRANERDDLAGCLLYYYEIDDKSVVTKANKQSDLCGRAHERELALNARNCITAMRSYQKLLRPTIAMHERHAIIFANMICLRLITAVRSDTGCAILLRNLISPQSTQRIFDTKGVNMFIRTTQCIQLSCVNNFSANCDCNFSTSS